MKAEKITSNLEFFILVNESLVEVKTYENYYKRKQ